MPPFAKDVIIRAFRDDDAAAVARIFFDAVHEGTRDHYTAEQRRAWAGDKPNPTRWLERLRIMIVFVAEMAGELVGFMTIDADGFVDLAFVSPSVSGSGVGWRLYLEVEKKARLLGAHRLHTEASLKARPFFERQGWTVSEKQTVVKKGVALTNFRMRKIL